MNLHEAICRLYGYVTAIGDAGAPLEQLKNCIDQKGEVNVYPSIPDKSQWYRICRDLERIIDHIEKINK